MRVAASIQNHARERHPAVDGVDIIAVGRRRHGVAMGIVKSEYVHARTYATREEAALDLFERIEVACNRARTHSALGYLSPAEFEGADWPAEEGRPKAA